MDADMPGNDTAPGDPRQRASRPSPPQGAPREPGVTPGRPRERREPRATPSDESAAGLSALLKWLPLRQILVFGIAIVGLYFVWPQLVNLFSQLPSSAASCGSGSFSWACSRRPASPAPGA